jgi:hypothetical protein
MLKLDLLLQIWIWMNRGVVEGLCSWGRRDILTCKCNIFLLRGTRDMDGIYPPIGQIIQLRYPCSILKWFLLPPYLALIARVLRNLRFLLICLVGTPDWRTLKYKLSWNSHTNWAAVFMLNF